MNGGFIFFAIIVFIITLLILISSLRKRRKIKQIGKDKKQKELIKNQLLEEYSFSEHFKPVDIEFYNEWMKRKFSKKQIFLVIMKLRNNKYTQFTITTKNRFFVKFGATYFIDVDMAEMDVSAKMNVLFYHQDVAMPFKVEVNVKELIDSAPQDEITNKILNPKSFKSFLHSEVIQMVIKGQELSKNMRMILMVLVIVGVLTLITLIMTIQSSGVL